MAKGLFIPYYQFAVSNLNAPYSYPPDVATETTDALIDEIVTNNLVHPWNGAQVASDIATLISLRTNYPNVPISLVVNGGADGAYWHDAGSVYDADFHSAMQSLRAVGIKVFGYIDPTVYTVSLASAKEKVDRWYSLYNDILDGIFIDDYAVADYLPDWPYLSVAYYDELNAYIRTKRNSTQSSVVPLLCGNINQWWLGNRDDQDSYYFSSANAPDFWLVAESIIDSSYLVPEGVSINKKWALLYNTSSASFSDAQFNDLVSNVDWVVISERNYATYQFLPNWLTRQAQLLSDFVLRYATFTTQPSVQSANNNGGVIAYSTNELMLADGSQLQLNQSETSSSQLKFISALSESQVKQTSLLNALELFQSTVSESQNKNAETVSSLLTFSGSTSEAQNKNTEASSASLNFAGSTAQAQLAQQESSSLALFFSGTIAELQALQAEALTGTITSQGVFVGSVNQLQTLQAESVLSAESFEAFISEVQLSQSEAVAVIQAFQGAAQSQKVQEEAGTGQLLFVGIVSQSQRLQSEFALDITPVIVKNASTVYASQIESAKRQIKAKGASVVWRSPQIIADEVKPWKVAGFANVEHTVSIVFDIVTGSNKSSRYLKDTNIEVGTEIGYMASVDFEPNLGDVVIRNDKELSVKNINTIQPDGNPILHIIEFAK